jgi:hypothetical protein
MPDLTTYLPLSALQPFFDNARADDNITEAWRTQYFGDLARIVHPALTAFFTALKAEGRMLPIKNSEGYSCRLWNTWNDAARLEFDTAAPADAAKKLDRLAEMFAHKLVFSIVYPYELLLRDEGVDAAAALDKNGPYTEGTSKFTQGDIPSWDFTHETCQRTGLPLIIRFEGWVAKGGYINGNRLDEIPAATPEMLQETVFELKTGNLLIADWFRITEFTNAVRGEKRFSLESRKGRDEQVRYLAEQFGVISVSVHTSPGVFQAENQVLVGYFDEEEGDVPERYTHVGNVCTDLWAATFVEYETLVDLVARTNPDSAKAIVDAYIEKHKGGVYGLHQIKVEPGTYHLYHFSENEEFAARAQQDGLKLDAGQIEPFFVFSRTRLRPDCAA